MIGIKYNGVQVADTVWHPTQESIGKITCALGRRLISWETNSGDYKKQVSSLSKTNIPNTPKTNSRTKLKANTTNSLTTHRRFWNWHRML